MCWPTMPGAMVSGLAGCCSPANPRISNCCAAAWALSRSNPVEDANLEAHIGAVRIANVPMHRWIMSPGLLNPSAIVRTVKRVIPEAA